MRAALVALTSLEVAVRGRRAALAGLELVRIHGKAHGAAGLAPLETGLDEYFVEALGFGLLFHQTGAGHDHGADVRIDRLAVHHTRNLAQIFDTPVGAG